MSNNVDVDVVVEAITRGFNELKADLRQVGNEATKTGKSVNKAGGDAATGFQKLEKGAKSAADTAVKAGAAIGAALIAVKQAYDLIKEAAEFQKLQSQFENLTASIGTTADALLGKLRTATQGMVSDAELIASGAQIISLGLADTEDGVVRLANLVSQLGWDMQQVIMTFANNSKMRLDALGLSVTDVEEKMRKLQASGMDADKAFDLAVIEAGEEKLALLGSAALTAAGQLEILESALSNVKTQLLEIIAARIGPWLEEFTGVETQGQRNTLQQRAEDIENLTAAQRHYLEVAKQFSDNLKVEGPDFTNWEVWRDVFEGAISKVLEFGTESDWAMLQLQLRQEGLVDAAELFGLVWEENELIIKANLLGLDAIDSKMKDIAKQQTPGMAYTEPGTTSIANTIDPRVAARQQRSRESAGNLDRIRNQAAAAEGAIRATATAYERLMAIHAARQQQMGENAQAFRGIEIEGVEGANEILLQTAASAGAGAEKLYELGGASEAAEEALKNLAINAKAAELGEQIAAGTITATAALQELDTFIQNFDLEELFAETDTASAGFTTQAVSAKQQMLSEVEGLATDVATTASTAKTDVDNLKGAMEAVTEPEWDVTLSSNANAINKEMAPIEATINRIAKEHTITFRINTIGEFPVPPESGGGKAMGGPVNAGVPYVVGEQGMEVFVPQQSGTIIPNHKLATTAGNGSIGSGITVNQFVQTPNPLQSANLVKSKLLNATQGMK